MRFSVLVVCAMAAGAGVGCGWLDDRPAAVQPANYTAAARAQTSTLFTSARPTFGAAVNDYFWVLPTPTQPIEFPHVTHIEKGLTCTEYWPSLALAGIFQIAVALPPAFQLISPRYTCSRLLV